MVEAVGGAAASVRSVNATAIATALPIHTSRNVSAEARELEPPLLAGAGFLALPLPAPPFGFGLLPFPMVKTQVYRYLAVKTVGGHFSGISRDADHDGSTRPRSLEVVGRELFRHPDRKFWLLGLAL